MHCQKVFVISNAKVMLPRSCLEGGIISLQGVWFNTLNPHCQMSKGVWISNAKVTLWEMNHKSAKEAHNLEFSVFPNSCSRSTIHPICFSWTLVMQTCKQVLRLSSMKWAPFITSIESREPVIRLSCNIKGLNDDMPMIVHTFLLHHVTLSFIQSCGLPKQIQNQNSKSIFLAASSTSSHIAMHPISSQESSPHDEPQFA